MLTIGKSSPHLRPSIGQEHPVPAGGGDAVALLLLAEVDGGVVVFDSILIRVFRGQLGGIDRGFGVVRHSHGEQSHKGERLRVRRFQQP